MSTLYVVATPIGNLADMTYRAVDCLKAVGVVYAEDTRRSRVLLDHFGISKPLRSMHEHNEKQRVADVVNALADGDVALLTDAGTPAVSDPGAELVAGIAREGTHKVVPIPGASALATALSVAGFSEGAVTFLGFLPVKGRERTEELAAIAMNRGIVVLYEAPHRIGDTLSDLTKLEALRPACVCRELTKMHEELARGTVKELAAKFSGEVRGEITIVLGPTTKERMTASAQDLDAAIKRALEAGLSARDAATAVAAILNLPKRDVYQRVQALSRQS
ncbi:MAG: 16S rRNA (cytidine(1402)-2'-O)-methyltransferase [Clostridia bacterium]|nr:16S rRNA (cytidine(1402)-2'-O)-methyltransferase [Deltaproteobacteria bacterium]